MNSVQEPLGNSNLVEAGYSERPKYSVYTTVRASPLDLAGPGGSTELTTVVGASAEQGGGTCSHTAALLRISLLLISQEECDETRT